MKFCTVCGAALEFFEFLDSDRCTSCQRRGAGITTQAAARPDEPVALGLLSEAVLLRENGKTVLKSKEGWVLWSLPDDEGCELEAMLKQARRILEIRRKRFGKS